jgi:hypothetical protein
VIDVATCRMVDHNVGLSASFRRQFGPKGKGRGTHYDISIKWVKEIRLPQAV